MHNNVIVKQLSYKNYPSKAPIPYRNNVIRHGNKRNKEYIAELQFHIGIM